MEDRFNTIAGWVLFASIVALGASVGSFKYFHADKPEQPVQPGYAIVVEGQETGEEAGPDLATLLAGASVESGERLFSRCAACHSVEQGGADGIGPNLFGVMNSAIGGHAAGFAYSDALSGKGGNWTWEDMDAWIENPRRFADGTKMSFAGLRDPQGRADLMVYMESLGGAPARPEPAVADTDPAGELAAEEVAEGVAAAAE